MPLPLIPQNGKAAMLRTVMVAIKNGANAAKVHLFENDYTPVLTSMVGDFVECSVGGMSVMPLPQATEQPLLASGPANWIFDLVTFTPSGVGLPGLVYGYWVDFLEPSTATTMLLWAQRFDSPQAIVTVADKVEFTPNLAGTQC